MNSTDEILVEVKKTVDEHPERIIKSVIEVLERTEKSSINMKI